MTSRDMVVIGASAGGVEALRALVPLLPADLPAAVCVVLHVPPAAPSVLPRILARRSQVRVRHATNGDRVEHGTVYIAPPDHHLLVKRGHLALVHGPRENGVRPAIDPLFRSAARAYGPRVIAVMLSGTLDDGVAALELVKRRGGMVVVQSPEETLFDGLARNTIARGLADHVCTIAELAALIDELVRTPLPAQVEAAMSTEERQSLDPDPLEQVMERAGTEPAGQLSGLTCPECQGSLWQQNMEGQFRYECRVGHAFSEEFLLSAKGSELESALWTALTAIEEHMSLVRRMSERMSQWRTPSRAEHYEQRLAELGRHAAVIRDVLLRTPGGEAATESVEAAS